MEVLLIDDHPLLNAGIISILESTGLFTICAQAESLAQAMSIIKSPSRREKQTLPSLIILDLLLGDDNGLDFLPMLEDYCRSKEIPKPPVLVCSALGDSFKIQAALRLGAAGFLSKTSGRAELLKAIDTILCGNVYVPDELNVKLSETSRTYAKFTRKEIEVIDLLKQNKTNQQIAKALAVSAQTVENYISKIYFKTGCSNRDDVKRL